MRPRIVMTLLVRDEEDILADNIAFHRSAGVDHFVITDNLSRDGTPGIIASFAREGIATVIHEPADDYDQSAWVTRMARMAAAEHGADWVINSDADEFWMMAGGSLRDWFASCPPEAGAVEVPRHNFACVMPATGRWCERMVYRAIRSINHIGRPLPPKVAHRACPTVVVRQGNHEVEGVAGDLIRRPGLEILHFPVRSTAQFENKIRNGGAAYRRNTKLPPTVARGWRELYDRLMREGSLAGYLASELKPADAVAAGLHDGSLVEDTRLRDRLRRLKATSQAADPDL